MPDPISFRLSVRARARLELLAEQLDQDRTTALELAIFHALASLEESGSLRLRLLTERTPDGHKSA